MRSAILKIALILLLPIAACNSDNEKINPGVDPETDNTTAGTDGNTKEITGFNISQAQPIDSTDYVIYPLSVSENDDNDNGIIYKSSGRSSIYHNIIFYNLITKKYHLLNNRKMLITTYSVKDGSVDYPVNSAVNQSSRYIYYKAIVKDYNGDGKLDMGDPEYLFISDLQGSYFKQISPDDMNVATWQEIPKKGKILMELTTDTNGDKKFEHEGTSIPYVYDVNNDETAKPVFNKPFTDSVSNLLKQQWGKK